MENNQQQNLVQKYIEQAKGIIAEEHLEYWAEIVPIRVDDIYEGMDLQSALEIISILNSQESETETFQRAKQTLNSQGHSGMSFSMVCAIVKRFHTNGDTFIQYIKNAD